MVLVPSVGAVAAFAAVPFVVLVPTCGAPAAFTAVPVMMRLKASKTVTGCRRQECMVLVASSITNLAGAAPP